MSLTVNFRTSRGIVSDRRFEPNEGVSVFGTVTGLILPASFQQVRLQIDETKTLIDTKTNVYGDYDFFVQMKDKGIYTIRIQTFFPTGTEEVVVPVGVGSSSALLPVETKTEGGVFQGASDTLKTIAMLATVAGIAYLAFVFIPMRRK